MTEVRSNPPKTLDTPENMHRGIALVLLPGYGSQQTTIDQNEPKGLINSPHVDRGFVVATVLGWLHQAGLDVKRMAPAFRLCVWPETWESQSLHGPQMVNALVKQSEAFIEEMNDTQPALIVLVSCYLHDALLVPEIENALELALGKPLMPPTRLCNTRLRAQAQRWERALVISLPIPSQRTTPAFVEALTNELKHWLNQDG